MDMQYCLKAMADADEPPAEADEGGTVFVGKSLLDALKAAAAAGKEPQRADLVKLFDTDALPEDEDLEAVDTSALGASFEADPPKAIDALDAKHGPKEVFQLILEAHAVLNDDAADSE